MAPPRSAAGSESLGDAYGVLGVSPQASAAEIKAAYRALVKRHHPDANGGDRASEDKLREIIQAYNYLKSSGAC